MFCIDMLKNEWSMEYRPLKYDVVIGRVDAIMVYVFFSYYSSLFSYANKE